MLITVQYGDIAQAAIYGKLDEHMAQFAADAEKADPGGNHELKIIPSLAWGMREKERLLATKKFYEAIEKHRTITP